MVLHFASEMSFSILFISKGIPGGLVSGLIDFDEGAFQKLKKK